MNQNSILTAKIFGTISIIATICGVALDFRPAAQPLTWSTMDEAKRVAAVSGKQIFVDVYAPWCGPCRQMDEAVFSEKPVKDKMQAEYVLARWNADDPEVARFLKDDYGINYLPTILVLSPQGKELKRNSGFIPTDGFLEWLKDKSYQYIASWKTYDQARSLSTQEQKPLLLLVAAGYAYTSNQNILRPFEDEGLRNLVDRNFVATVLVERNPVDKKNLNQLKVAPLQSYPTLLLLSPDGKELGRIEMTYDLSYNHKKLFDWAQTFVKNR